MYLEIFKKFLFILIFFTITGFCATQSLNIYNWSNSIDPEVLKVFEAETGIHVNYDVYDNAEVMEAKLLAGGSSGYDIVFASTWPNLERLIPEGVFRPLDKSRLSFFKTLDKPLMKKMALADPGNGYALPYMWGTTGFAYNVNEVKKHLPDAPVKSYAMLFDPSVVKTLSACGVVWIDSVIDLIPAALSYLKLPPNSEKIDDLKKASALLSAVRTYVKKPQSFPSPEALAAGRVCVSQGWSGEMMQAIKLAKEIAPEREIRFVVPTEGGSLWIDAVAITRSAQNLDGAYLFLNFLMRPDIIAQITNTLQSANAVPDSLPYVSSEIKNNKSIYLSKKTFDKLSVDNAHTPSYERLRNREWLRVKSGR